MAVDDECLVREDDVTNETELDENRQRRWKCRNVLSFLTVEPVVFTVCLGFGIQMVISQDLLIFKSCHINLGYDLDICANLSGHPDAQVEVQKLSATLSMYLNILTALPSIVVSLFLGPWSDTNGRKPLLIAPIFGFLLTQIVYIVSYHFTSLTAEYLLFSAVSNMFGGFTCLLIGVYGYIADVSRLRSRTSRVALVDLFLFFGFPLGVFLSDYIFKAGGFYLVFGIGLLLNVMSLLYATFYIRETHESNSRSDAGSDEQIRLFDLKNVASVFKTVFKARDNGLRAVLLMLLLAMMINVAASSDSGTTYLFTRLKFSWTEEEFTRWASTTSIVRALCTFSIMPILSLKLQLHDALIGLVGSVMGVAALLVYAFSTKSWMFYLGAGISILASTPAIVIRSLLSKIVPKTDLGKVFSILSSLESAAPLLISPIIVTIYKATIDHFAGTIFIVFATLYLLVTLCLIVVYVVLKRPNGGYDQLHNEVQHVPEQDSSVAA